MSVTNLFGLYTINSFALLLLAIPTFGQGFSQLATNLDGSILYFSSPLRMKGTNQYLPSTDSSN